MASLESEQQLSTTMTLRPDVQSVAKARALVGTALAGSPIDAIRVAQLCADELIANVANHAHTACELTVDIQHGAARLLVHDYSDQVPVLRRQDTSAVSGRGLVMVAAFSNEWGYVLDEDGHGKTAWCLIALRADQ